MAEKLHPVYEKFLAECYKMVQEKLATGTIGSVEELETYVLQVCSPLSATDGFSFICEYSPFNWSSIVSIDFLQECQLDLVLFIKETFRIIIASELMMVLAAQSDGYRYLVNGGETATISLQPNTTPVEFTEYWKSEVDQYCGCKVLESVSEDNAELTIYQPPDGFQWVYVMNHLDDSLVWIGKPVEN